MASECANEASEAPGSSRVASWGHPCDQRGPRASPSPVPNLGTGPSGPWEPCARNGCESAALLAHPRPRTRGRPSRGGQADADEWRQAQPCVVSIVRVRQPYGHDGLCGSDCADARAARRGFGGEQGMRVEHGPGPVQHASPVASASSSSLTPGRWPEGLIRATPERLLFSRTPSPPPPRSVCSLSSPRTDS